MCSMGRIWAHEISIFVVCLHDIAHPSSGLAQSLRRICSDMLTFAHPNFYFSRLPCRMLNYFNSSRVGLELVPYVKMGKMGKIQTATLIGEPATLKIKADEPIADVMKRSRTQICS